MIKIALTQDKTSLISDEDADLVSQFKWSAVRRKGKWYTLTNLPGGGGTTSIHRLVCGLKTGDPAKVDHIDGNGLNNQRSNLRLCDNQRNRWNSASHVGGTSRYKGVSWHKFKSGAGKWRGQITVDGVKYRLGLFDTEEAAARACDALMIELHGEFARLNFPLEVENG